MAIDNAASTIATDAEAGVLIGRGNAWVPDPFDAYRDLVGEHASELDDLATLIGEEISGRDVAGQDLPGPGDGWLEDRASQLGWPLGEISPERAAATLAWDARVAEAETALKRATESALLIAGRKARVVDGAWLPDAGRPDVWRPVGDVAKRPPDGYDAERDRVDTLIGTAAELAESRAGSPDGGRYLHDFVAADKERLAESIAIARERAIRQELRAQRERALAETVRAEHGVSDLDSREPAARRRQIGVGDVSAITERRRMVWAQEHPDCHIRRDQVSPPRSSDRLEPRIGLRRSVSLSVRMHPLVGWLEDQPDEWIRSRSAELGQPDASLDFDAALKERRLEAGLLNALHEKNRAMQERADFYDEDPERAAASDITADKAEDEAYGIRRKLRPLGARLDAWMTDDVVLAAAYADELAIRNEIAIAQQVELSVLEPPPHITELIGPAPERHKSYRDSWEQITRAVEHERLAGQSDPQHGTETQSRDPQLPPELDQQIDQLRAYRHMEPRPPTRLEMTATSVGMESI